MKQITDQTIWITGASSGIGHQVAEDLARAGNRVVISARSKNKLNALAAAYPDHIQVLAFDANDTGACYEAGQQLGTMINELDMLVMAAGVCEYVDHVDTDEHLYKRVFETNFFAAIRTFNIALPFLRKSRKQAVIAGVGSLSAQVPFTRAQAYGASKAAFEYWLGTMQIDLHKEGIRVVTVSPGFVETPMTAKNDFEMPTIISVQQASQAIVKGLSSGQRTIRFPKKLYWPLRFFSVFDGLWHRFVGPKLVQQEQLQTSDVTESDTRV